MFKSFTGYHLVEHYHNRKKRAPQHPNADLSKALKIIFVVAMTLLVWCLPSDSFGIPNLSIVE